MKKQELDLLEPDDGEGEDVMGSRTCSVALLLELDSDNMARHVNKRK